MTRAWGFSLVSKGVRQGGSQRVGIDCSSLWEFLRKAIFSKSNLKKDGVRANPFRRMRRTVVREFARKNWRTKGFDHSLRSKARLSSSSSLSNSWKEDMHQNLSFWLRMFRIFCWSLPSNGDPMHAPIGATPSAYCLLLFFRCLDFRNWPDPWRSYEACLTPPSQNQARVCVEIGLIKENLPNRLLIGSTVVYLW